MRHGEFVPVTIPERRSPERLSLLDLDAADDLGNDEETNFLPASGGAGMKTGAGGHPQPYDSWGRYTGPTGGVYDRGTGGIFTFGAEEDEGDKSGGSADQDVPPEWRIASDYGTDQPADVEPAIYQLENEEEPQVVTAEYGDDAANVLDAIPADAEGDKGWDNEDRRLEEKRFRPQRLVQNARAEIGSDEWAPTTENGEIRNHCNEYVASKLRESGAHVPNVGGFSGTLGEDPSDRLNEMSGGRWGGNIPSAKDWGNENLDIPGYRVVTTPQPGDIASNGFHVGIVSGDGKTLSASSLSGRVVENDWGFRQRDRGTITFRRYVGLSAWPEK